MTPCRMALVTLIAILLAGGCAKYEYLLIEPAALAQTIGPESEAAIELSPLHYRFVHAGSRLGVRIANQSERPIGLVGEKSYVVDAGDQTHGLASGTIAPGSFIAFTLPPTPRVYRGSGSRFSIGVGVGSYSGLGGPGFGGYAADDPFYDHGYAVYEEPVWEWSTGIVRLRLWYEPEQGEAIDHAFTIERRKIEN